jgi:uncharacterized surface protein with fasciclin (FAS1) repeats
MKFLRKLLAVLCVMGMLTSCGGNDDDNFGNLATVAQQRGFTALLVAVEKAGLTAELNAEHANLTVLAPSNAAFDTLATQLGFANAGELVTTLPASDLSKILRYHLIAGNKFAADIRAAGTSLQTAYLFDGTAATLQLKIGASIVVTDAVLTDASVTASDVRADNGVIHVVDKVLIPPGVLNVVQMAQANPAAFSSLVGAVVSAGLVNTLSGVGPFTVFAPVNSAFAAAPAGLTNTQLASVLAYHVLPVQVLSTAIPFGTPLATLDRLTLAGEVVAPQTITINSDLTITDTTTTPARILATDVRAANGVIHVIGKVLIPR